MTFEYSPERVVEVPLALRAIYTARHLANSQNLFLKTERKLLGALAEKYDDLPDGEMTALEKVSVDDFDFEAFNKAGTQFKPFVIKNFFPPDAVTWEDVKTKYGDTIAPIHPKANIHDDYMYNAPDELPIRDVVDQMERDGLVYVIGSSLIFTENPEIEEKIQSGRVTEKFGRHIFRKEMFMGGPQVGSVFHCAPGDNFFYMVSGRKRWTFVAPEHYLAMYPTVGRSREGYAHGSEICTDGYEERQRSRFPLFAKVPKYTVTLEPGDLLCNPSMWWHQVENLERTIGVPHRTLSETRYELLSLFNIARKEALSYILNSVAHRLFGAEKHTADSNRIVTQTYGGTRKNAN